MTEQIESSEFIHNPNAMPVFQGGLAIIDDRSLITEIGTLGLGPCIGVVLYHPDKKFLVVGHFDEMTDVFGSFLNILTYAREAGLSDTDIDNLEVSVLGGDSTSTDLYSKVKKAVNDTSFGQIVLDQYNKSNGKPVRFVVDVNDGNIRTNEMPTKPENPKNRQKKLDRVKKPGRSVLVPDYISIKGKTRESR